MHGGHHRRADELGELEDLLVRVRDADAAAEVDDRARRAADEQRGVLEARLLADRRVVAGDVDRLRVAVPLDLGVEDVLRDVDEHRAGAAGPRDVERLLHHARDLAGVGHEPVVLRDRHRDAGDVRLLERVRADERGGDVRRHRDERHRVHVRVGDRGDEVRRAGAGGIAVVSEPAAGAGLDI